MEQAMKVYMVEVIADGHPPRVVGVYGSRAGAALALAGVARGGNGSAVFSLTEREGYGVEGVSIEPPPAQLTRDERDAEIVRLAREGVPYAEIGRLFNMTKARAAQIAKEKGEVVRRRTCRGIPRCTRGHLLREGNYYERADGYRVCRVCHAETARKSRQKKLAEERAEEKAVRQLAALQKAQASE